MKEVSKMRNGKRARRRSSQALAWGLILGLKLVAGAVVADNVGANGQILDAYKQTLSSVSSGQCFHTGVPVTEVINRCGDDDGCTLRLVSDNSNGNRAGTPPMTFATDSIGWDWTLSVLSGWSNVKGLNGDAVQVEIIEARSAANASHCELWDDYGSLPPESFALVVCNMDAADQGLEASCTLRIDD
jgi:hypothetical protein